MIQQFHFWVRIQGNITLSKRHLHSHVEVLDFIPDNVIIGGYFELYLLAERAGAKFAQSEHAFFVQDQTVFKGTARYDGQPVIAEGFVAIGINSTTPNATMPFAPDTVNP